MRIVGRIAAAIGCGFGILGSAAAHAAVTPPLRLGECVLPHPLRLYSVEALCGTLRVPENGADPRSGKIGLRVAVVRALNRRSGEAPLFLLAGGPGQSAVDMYVSAAAAFARVNRDHDIVMVDQRGTGKSGPLHCDYPDDWQDDTQTMAGVRRATLACLSHFGDRVRWYTTSVAVRDLDEVRRALGYRRIDLYGASYGTRVAEQYMRRYAPFVHAAILDGVVDPTQAIGPQTPLDGERALRQIVDRCLETRDCASMFPRLPQELADLRRRFGPEKVAMSLPDPADGERRTVSFTRDTLSGALRFLSYSAAEASLLPLLIHQAANGDLAPLADQAIMMSRHIGDQLASGMQNTVICSEDVPLFGAAKIDERATGRHLPGNLYNSMRCGKFARCGRTAQSIRICMRRSSAAYRRCCSPARTIRSPRRPPPNGSPACFRVIDC